jgi:hypothetical protein
MLGNTRCELDVIAGRLTAYFTETVIWNQRRGTNLDMIWFDLVLAQTFNIFSRPSSFCPLTQLSLHIAGFEYSLRSVLAFIMYVGVYVWKWEY